VSAAEAALDRASTDALARAFEFSSVIVHAAGVSRAGRESTFESVNVEGTRAVVDAANDAGARLILISSLAAAGAGTARHPRKEDDEPRPITAYGRSKLAAEAVVRTEARVPWSILRPSAIYGPRDRQFLPLFRLASRGISLLATDPATPFTLIYVDDAVRAVLLAAAEDRAASQTVFLGHPHAELADDVLRYLSQAFNRPYRPRRIAPWALDAASYVGELAWLLGQQPLIDRRRLVELRAEGFVCAVDRAREVLGFTATTGWQAGAAATARWYRSQGWV
jgi:nucleoside-diphosphate-sugar epimerase